MAIVDVFTSWPLLNSAKYLVIYNLGYAQFWKNICFYDKDLRSSSNSNGAGSFT